LEPRFGLGLESGVIWSHFDLYKRFNDSHAPSKLNPNRRTRQTKQTPLNILFIALWLNLQAYCEKIKLRKRDHVIKSFMSPTFNVTLLADNVLYNWCIYYFV